MSVNITNRAVSDKITRERTFDIHQFRSDNKDTIGQLVITLTQILDEKFQGCIEIHCANGKIINVKARESQRVP